jgi:hypothetical protein
VTSSGNYGVLGNNYVVANIHNILIVYPNTLADPTAVTNSQFPRKLDPSTRPKDYVLADIRTKEAKSRDPES